MPALADKKLDVAKLFGAFASIFKAIPDDKLADIKDVADLWTDGDEHKNPSRSEILTGPAEKMSGGGAEPMVRRYSDFATQEGMTRQYEAFERMLGDMGKALGKQSRMLGSMAGVLSDVVKNHQALGTTITEIAAKAQEAPKVEALDENTFFGKAVSKYAKARQAFRKAEMEDEDDKEKREERKSNLEAALKLLKSAMTLVSKAEDEDDEKDEDKMEKAIADIRVLTTRVTKSLAAVTKAEHDEEKEKEEAEKARVAADAASKGAKVDVAATAKAEGEQEKEEKKEDTAKAVTQEDLSKAVEQITESLKGNSVPSATITEFMNLFSQASKSIAPPPNFVMKAAPTTDVATRIDEALDNGALATPTEANTATALLHRLKLADAGRYSRDQLNSDIAAAPETVRQLFAVA